jgi:probable rRNA maturation factor
MPTGPKKRSIDIRVFPTFRGLVKTPFARRAATAALKVADPTGDRDVSVVVADDETLHDLNLRYRGFDEPTDVLSFGDESDASLAEEDADDGPAFPELPDESLPLGEIVLSYPLAVRQAGEHNVSVDEEVALLIVHGVLHLLGHDHAEAGEEAVMKALETQALAALFAKSSGATQEARSR